jgi:Bacterial Ig-like domain (group 2)
MVTKRISNLVLYIALFSVMTLSACGAGGSGTVKVSSSGTQANLTSIELTPTNPSIAVGTNQQFTVTGVYSDHSTQDVTQFAQWTSSDTNKVTVSSAGMASGKGIGSATVTAHVDGFSHASPVTVTGAVLQSLAINPTNPSIAKGTTQQFTVTGTFSDHSTQDLTTTVTWASSSTGVASISNAAGSKGLATAVGAGTTTITATSGSVANTTTLTVTGSGTASLTWDAPTQFTDGTYLNPATDIKTYKLYYGTVDQNYTQIITFTNPGTLTVTEPVTLPAGTYCFVVTSVSQSGDESLYSNQVWKTF